MLYNAVPRAEVLDALVHLRELYRQIKPSSEREFLAYERREAATRDLLSNLPRVSEHPTLRTLLEIADVFQLTLGGAHRLFGYDLDAIREYDIRLNAGRTHIVESYPFGRDLAVDLPSQLAAAESFAEDAPLRDLIAQWQTGVPIRTLQEGGWNQPNTFYVHVGTEDSLGLDLPPGALAMVTPADEEERTRPSPRGIYFLQFGNGYRCCHCVATRGKLRLFTTAKIYLGPEEFIYPGDVRIAGRVRMFAVSLPIPEYPMLRALPPCQPCADLILPWEHQTRDRLLATEYRRFKRSKEEEQLVREFLKGELHAKLSHRSERRYRRPTTSEPHVNALIHLSVAHLSRYSDALRTGGSLISDKDRFSLETLLNARRLEDALIGQRTAHFPAPREVWEARLKEFVEWPPLLSLKFPQLRVWDNRVMRLAEESTISGLNPSIGAGSWVLLEKSSTIPDIPNDRRKTGWSRPIYVLQRGLRAFCGFLERDGDQFAVSSGTRSDEVKTTFRADEFALLSRVAGIAVPV